MNDALPYSIKLLKDTPLQHFSYQNSLLTSYLSIFYFVTGYFRIINILTTFRTQVCLKEFRYYHYVICRINILSDHNLSPILINQSRGSELIRRTKSTFR